jgi:Chaperone of endosialidase
LSAIIDGSNASSLPADSTINGVTVGKGGGSVATNTVLGYQAGNANSTGARSVYIGYTAGLNQTAGYNTAVGCYALQGSGAGTQNSALGEEALYSNTSGSYNTALGASSLALNTTASNNTAVGYQAGYTNTAGAYNTFIGYQAGYYSNPSTTNNGNTLVGYTAGYNLTTGTGNSFLGGTNYGQCGYYVTTGNYNTIIGGYNGNQGGLDIRTSSNYIVLSDGAGNPRAYWSNTGHAVSTCSETNNDALVVKNTSGSSPYGIDVVFSITPNNTTNYFFQGEDSTNNKIAIYSSGTISNRTGTYNTISDIKIKQDVKDATSQWNDIKAIRFKKYRLIDDVKANPDAPYLMGVVAQELQQTSPNLIDECIGKDGEVTLGVKQSIIFMKAAKALQEAMERIESLEAKVTSLEAK